MRFFDKPRQSGAKGSTVSDMSEEWGVSFLSERARQRYTERLQARRNGQKILSNPRPASTPAPDNLSASKPTRNIACTDDLAPSQSGQVMAITPDSKARQASTLPRSFVSLRGRGLFGGSMKAKGGQIVCVNCTVRVLPDLDQCPFEWLGQEPEERKYWWSGLSDRNVESGSHSLVFTTERAAWKRRELMRGCSSLFDEAGAPVEQTREEVSAIALADGRPGVVVKDETGQVVEEWPV